MHCVSLVLYAHEIQRHRFLKYFISKIVYVNKVTCHVNNEIIMRQKPLVIFDDSIKHPPGKITSLLSLKLPNILTNEMFNIFSHVLILTELCSLIEYNSMKWLEMIQIQ